jgi:hypothetical protein
MVVYWLGWACNLHQALNENMGKKSHFAENGIDVKRRHFNYSDKSAVSPFLEGLEDIVSDCYKLAVQLMTTEVRILVERKVRSFWDVEVESSAIGQDMVDYFERWFCCFVNSGVPQTMLNQWFYQALYILNALVFNSFLKNPRLCEAAIALQLKFYVSELENWSSQHANVLYHWRSFKIQLQPLVDFTNLLLLDKANIAVPMLREGAPSLALPQVKFLLDGINEYAAEVERAPKSVLKDVSDACQMDVSQRVPYEKAAFKEEKWFVLADLARN